MVIRSRIKSGVRRWIDWLLALALGADAIAEAVDDTRPPMPVLKLRIWGQDERITHRIANPVAAQGLGVLCILDGSGTGYHLATEGQCTSRADFWLAWKLTGGPEQRLRVEGELYEPPL